MAFIFQAAQFADVQALAPRIGFTTALARPAEPNTPVILNLQDGTVVRIADTVVTLLKVMEQCRQRGQSMVSLGDDATLIWVGFAKGIIVENSLALQKLLASYQASYDSGHLRWVHRSLASYLTTKDALVSVGLTIQGQISSNPDFVREGISMLLFDIEYRQAPSADVGVGSCTEDLAVGQIIYDWEARPPIPT